MNAPWQGRRAAAGLALAVLLGASGTQAQQANSQDKARLEIAPFAGYGFGGTFQTGTEAFGLGSGLSYGGSIDYALSDSWALTGLYSRRSNDVGTPFGPVGLVQEHYMLGIAEVKGSPGDRTRFFGAGLAGVTRFAPRGFDSLVKPAVGLVLGIKHAPSRRIGLRFEWRGYMTFPESGGGVVCNAGTCLFSFGATTFLQGELAAGIIIGL